MFKLTVIGAVLVATASASVFQNKLALKRAAVFASNSTSPSTPQEIFEEYRDAYLESDLPRPSEILDEYKEAFVSQLMDCYDVDGDNKLSRDEFETYIVQSYTGGRCPSATGSNGISTSQKSTLTNWVANATSITQVYSAQSGSCDKGDFIQAISGRSNIIVVGQTFDGATVGGYTGSAAIPTSNTTSWITGSNMFIFNLESSQKWTSSYTSLNIWINTYSQYSDVIDFGYHNALQFEVANGECTVKYNKSFDFYADPSNTAVGVESTNEDLSSIQVFQVNF